MGKFVVTGDVKENFYLVHNFRKRNRVSCIKYKCVKTVVVTNMEQFLVVVRMKGM